MLVVCEKCGDEISEGKSGQENRVTLDICKDCRNEGGEKKSPQGEAFSPEPDDSPADYDPYDDNYDELMDRADWPENDESEYHYSRAEEEKEEWLAGVDLDEGEYPDDYYDWPPEEKNSLSEQDDSLADCGSDLPPDWFMSVSG